MNESAVTAEQIIKAAALLREGRLVAFPTETVYGLGADARNERAVQRVFEAKGRPSNNPLIVHVASLEQALACVDLSRSCDPIITEQRLLALATLWPGPLSVVLPKASDIAPAVSAGGPTIAVRIPRHPVALRLIREFNGPIAAPSANRSMYVSPTSAAHVHEGLGESIAMILDGGPCEVGLESTVISIVHEQPKLLRPGAITLEQLEQTLGCDVDCSIPASPPPSSGALLSPGLMAKHYSPRTPVILRSHITHESILPEKVGVILFAPAELPFPIHTKKIISSNHTLTEVAAALFATLRELDQLGLNVIVVDVCEPVGLGAAIMDRLLRAAASH